MEAAVQSLKKGKSSGVDNIPAELVQIGGEEVITALMTICNNMWQTGESMANPMDPVLSHHTSQERQPAELQNQNYRTISLISHFSKVMLKIILNRVKLQVEKTIAEEHVCLRAGVE